MPPHHDTSTQRVPLLPHQQRVPGPTAAWSACHVSSRPTVWASWLPRQKWVPRVGPTAATLACHVSSGPQLPHKRWVPHVGQITATLAYHVGSGFLLWAPQLPRKDSGYPPVGPTATSALLLFF